jgi:DNA-binding NtrC family response regulator
VPPDCLDLTTAPEPDEPRSETGTDAGIFVLCVLWCREEPWRIGEVLPVPWSVPAPVIRFGRGLATGDGPGKSQLGHLRPGEWRPAPPLAAPSISRDQLELRALSDREILVKNVGRAGLLHQDRETTEAHCQAGDVLQIGKQLLLLCCHRPRLRAWRSDPSTEFPFGVADHHGFVGESASAWQLRQQLAFVAARLGHVLVQGAPGSGKHLLVQALHALSPRREQNPVVCSAAASSSALAELELFGNVADYPTTGMAARAGWLAAADGSNLLLDGLAELPAHSQARLARALDGGEYQCFGEARTRTSDFRLFATTSAPPKDLKEELRARFALGLQVPDLNQRREDIPLLVRHSLRRQASLGDEAARRCFANGDPRGEPDVPLDLIRALVQRHYTTNVRELEAELWSALATRELGPSAAANWGLAPRQSTPPHATGPNVETLLPPALGGVEDTGELLESATLAPANIQRTLDENNGSLELTWPALGLKNRFALVRLIKRHGLEIRKRPTPIAKRKR